MARRSQPEIRQGAFEPCMAVAPAGKSPCGLLALALWLCIALAAGLAAGPELSPVLLQAGFASACPSHAPLAGHPLSLPHAGLERDGAGRPLLSAAVQFPLLPARLDAGEDRFKRHGQKDRNAFHGFAGSGTQLKATTPAARFARLALPASPCSQAWRCYALFALPPPSFHA